MLTSVTYVSYKFLCKINVQLTIFIFSHFSYCIQFFSSRSNAQHTPSPSKSKDCKRQHSWHLAIIDHARSRSKKSASKRLQYSTTISACRSTHFNCIQVQSDWMLKYSESRLEGKEQKKDINNRKFQICGSAFGTGMSVFSMPTILVLIFLRETTRWLVMKSLEARARTQSIFRAREWHVGCVSLFARINFRLREIRPVRHAISGREGYRQWRI